jgi:putative two-component system response regulator
MATILVVDDQPINRKFLATLLGRAGHRLLEASNGAEALAVARGEGPDLIITDILMPSMDGYAFVRYLRVTSGIEQTPVIFWTATYLEREAKLLASACGVVHVLSKPCKADCLLHTVDRVLDSAPQGQKTPLPEFDRLHLRLITNKLAQKMSELEAANSHLEQLLEDLSKANADLGQAYDATLEGWVRALDLRDHETEGHSQRVTQFSTLLAQAIGIDGGELRALRRGALLHDIGKLGVPDRILHKPGALDEGEWKLMRLHPAHARQMLEPIPFLRPALDIPYRHHEKWDGTGYPDGLNGEEIPLPARIFAVVDVWDALRSNRPYRDAWPKKEARQYIDNQSGKHFDPEVARSFLRLEW